MANLLESIRIGTSLLYPFLPQCSEKVLAAFGIEATSQFDGLENFDHLKEGQEIKPTEILFPRLDIAAEFEKLKNIMENK